MVRAKLALFSGLAAGMLLVTGCGLEAVDYQMRTRGDIGVPDERALQVAEVEFVCPHNVPQRRRVAGVDVDPTVEKNEKAAKPKDVEIGEIEGLFGPYIPCGNVVEAGTGTCSKCDQPYRTPGERAEGDDPAPLATWKLSCPVCKEGFSPVALATVRMSDPAMPNRVALNQCPKCQTYLDTTPGDVLSAVAIHEEVVCPSCTKPIDPSLNACTTSTCRLGGVVRNVDNFEGPCWRCGGQGICPECHGSGTGTLSIYGPNTNINCWSCEAAGRCHECDGSGFTIYTGGLPQKFATTKMAGGVATPQESKDRNWRHPEDAAPASDESAPDSGDGE
jgi:hypothetical protein